LDFASLYDCIPHRPAGSAQFTLNNDGLDAADPVTEKKFTSILQSLFLKFQLEQEYCAMSALQLENVLGQKLFFHLF